MPKASLTPYHSSRLRSRSAPAHTLSLCLHLALTLGIEDLHCSIPAGDPSLAGHYLAAVRDAAIAKAGRVGP